LDDTFGAVTTTWQKAKPAGEDDIFVVSLQII
jgi:hypothetical protein